MDIQLDIDGIGMVSAEVLGESEEPSPHTGRPLRRAEVRFRTGSDAAREQVVATLENGKIRGRSGGDGAVFKVGSHSHSFVQGSAVTTFTAEVEEVEDLVCDTVVLDGSVDLSPDLYAEEYRDGAVVVTLVTSTSGDRTTAFEATLAARRGGDYFTVVRRGVSDDPLRMRFGRCLYRDNDDGTRTHKVVLVQDVYDDRDEPPFSGFNQPEMRRAEDAIVVLQHTVDRLLALLVETGMVAADAAAVIRDEAKDVSSESRRQFDRTEDDADFTVN